MPPTTGVNTVELDVRLTSVDALLSGATFALLLAERHANRRDYPMENKVRSKQYSTCDESSWQNASLGFVHLRVHFLDPFDVVDGFLVSNETTRYQNIAGGSK